MMVVTMDHDVRAFDRKEILGFRIDADSRWPKRLTGNLFTHDVQMVSVKMDIATTPDEFTYTQVADMRNQM